MSLLASGMLVSPVRQSRRGRRRGEEEGERARRREISEDYDVKAYEGEIETDGATERETKEPRLVSMAPKRRGVYVVSADVSFLLANKASL